MVELGLTSLLMHISHRAHPVYNKCLILNWRLETLHAVP